MIGRCTTSSSTVPTLPRSRGSTPAARLAGDLRESDDFVVVVAPSAQHSGVAFQLAPDHVPPVWGDPSLRSRCTSTSWSTTGPRRRAGARPGLPSAEPARLGRLRRPRRPPVLPHRPSVVGATGPALTAGRATGSPAARDVRPMASPTGDGEDGPHDSGCLRSGLRREPRRPVRLLGPRRSGRRLDHPAHAGARRQQPAVLPLVPRRQPQTPASTRSTATSSGAGRPGGRAP